MKMFYLSGFVAVATAAGLVIGSNPASSYVAHEWGTFTSVQGGDGVLLNWQPLESSRLPKFVYDWNKPGLPRQNLFSFISKGTLSTLQRMETPVIYFYSAKEQSVDVSVRFPQGLITEWYPRASEIQRGTIPNASAGVGPDNAPRQAIASPDACSTLFSTNITPTGSHAQWTHLEILPEKQNQSLSRALPQDSSGNHYFAARQTDSDYLRSSSPLPTDGSAEHEKFIFYRGAGNFGTPLRVTIVTSGSTAIIENISKEPLKHLVVLQLRDRSGNFHFIDQIAPGEKRTVLLDSKAGTVPVETLSRQLGERMSQSLVEAGLYQREAAAMVKTWNDSWFQEEGLRVLYVLPRSWTDRTLPLTLNPPPHELVRVMVGRAEVLTPKLQQTLADAVAKSSQNDPRATELAVAEFRKFGRFGEPALRLATKGSTAEITQRAWTLLRDAAAQSQKETKAF